MTAMIDLEHQKAQELAAEAATAVKAGRHARAVELYDRAAGFEARALARVPRDKPRTRGILGVSLAALHYKAGQYEEVMRVARKLLVSRRLPADARAQLEQIVDAARSATGDPALRRRPGYTSRFRHPRIVHGLEEAFHATARAFRVVRKRSRSADQAAPRAYP